MVNPPFADMVPLALAPGFPLGFPQVSAGFPLGFPQVLRI